MRVSGLRIRVQRFGFTLQYGVQYRVHHRVQYRVRRFTEDASVKRCVSADVMPAPGDTTPSPTPMVTRRGTPLGKLRAVATVNTSAAGPSVGFGVWGLGF